jgi:DnaK suppressor protein
MNKQEMQKFKKLLLAKKEDLLNVVRNKKQRDLTDSEVGDEIDSASQSTEKELLFELADNEKVVIDAIEGALRRIEKGSFGKCEYCGIKIPEKRLKAIPWVRYDIECQTKLEKTK